MTRRAFETRTAFEARATFITRAETHQKSPLQHLGHNPQQHLSGSQQAHLGHNPQQHYLGSQQQSGLSHLQQLPTEQQGPKGRKEQQLQQGAQGPHGEQHKHLSYNLFSDGIVICINISSFFDNN